MPTLKDDCVVLRLMDWSETSQIAVLLSRDHGKVSATAKGAKRATPSVMAKFSGGLETVTRGEAVWISRPSRDLANLTEWDLTDGYWGVRRNLAAFDLAMYAVDLVHHILHDDDPHPATFEALTGFLQRLGGGRTERSDSLEDSPPTGQVSADLENAEALLRFQWNVIEDAGLRPSLEAGGDDEVMRFSPTAGGLVGAGDANAWRVRRKTIEALRAAATGEALDEADDSAIIGANRLLCTYCRAILDKHLPTMAAVLGER